MCEASSRPGRSAVAAMPRGFFPSASIPVLEAPDRVRPKTEPAGRLRYLWDPRRHRLPVPRSFLDLPWMGFESLPEHLAKPHQDRLLAVQLLAQPPHENLLPKHEQVDRLLDILHVLMMPHCRR